MGAGGSRLGSAVADAQRLTQVVMQLAENVCHHTPENTRVVIGTAAASGRLRIWVQDDGPGLTEEDRARAFDNFHRSRTGHRGTGLGLPIVRAIAEAHGGSVRVTPVRPHGARFEVDIPLVAATTVDAQPPQEERMAATTSTRSASGNGLTR